jgi:hypothetical protein
MSNEDALVLMAASAYDAHVNNALPALADWVGNDRRSGSYGLPYRVLTNLQNANAGGSTRSGAWTRAIDQNGVAEQKYMETVMSAIRRWLRWLLMTASVTSIGAGCASSLTHKWQEEVLLSDGSVVLVNREVRYGPGAPARPSTWTVREERLTIIDPPTPTWHGPTQRLAWYLDRRDDHFILIAYQTVCQVGDKQPVWRAYISSASGWSEVPLTELRTAVTPNMALFATHTEQTAKWSRMSVEEKSKFDYSRITPTVKRIDPNSVLSCP